jgi:hypothetical protein
MAQLKKNSNQFFLTELVRACHQISLPSLLRRATLYFFLKKIIYCTISCETPALQVEYIHAAANLHVVYIGLKSSSLELLPYAKLTNEFIR